MWSLTDWRRRRALGIVKHLCTSRLPPVEWWSGHLGLCVFCCRNMLWHGMQNAEASFHEGMGQKVAWPTNSPRCTEIVRTKCLNGIRGRWYPVRMPMTPLVHWCNWCIRCEWCHIKGCSDGMLISSHQKQYMKHADGSARVRAAIPLLYTSHYSASSRMGAMGGRVTPSFRRLHLQWASCHRFFILSTVCRANVPKDPSNEVLKTAQSDSSLRFLRCGFQVNNRRPAQRHREVHESTNESQKRCSQSSSYHPPEQNYRNSCVLDSGCTQPTDLIATKTPAVPRTLPTFTTFLNGQNLWEVGFALIRHWNIAG